MYNRSKKDLKEMFVRASHGRIPLAFWMLRTLQLAFASSDKLGG